MHIVQNTFHNYVATAAINLHQQVFAESVSVVEFGLKFYAKTIFNDNTKGRFAAEIPLRTNSERERNHLSVNNTP